MDLDSDEAFTVSHHYPTRLRNRDRDGAGPEPETPSLGLSRLLHWSDLPVGVRRLVRTAGSDREDQRLIFSYRGRVGRRI